MSEFDRAKAKAFSQRMVRHLEGASVAIMIEVGRRVGLFEAMAKMSAVSSDVIAAKFSVSERYIREWLGVMVSGGIAETAVGNTTILLHADDAAMGTCTAYRDVKIRD